MGDSERVEGPGYTKAGNISAMVERNRGEIRKLQIKAATIGDPDGTLAARIKGLMTATSGLVAWLARNPPAA